MKNLNCGLSSGINYQEALPRMVHSLVMAHELGHNLGSHHDTDGEQTIGSVRFVYGSIFNPVALKFVLHLVVLVVTS